MRLLGRDFCIALRLCPVLAIIVVALLTPTPFADAWAETKPHAFVVMIDVTARDDISMSRTDRLPPPPLIDGPVFIRNGTLWIPMDIVGPYGRKPGPQHHSVEVAEEIQYLSDIGGVVVERIRYVGKERLAIRFNMYLGRELPAPPRHGAPLTWENKNTDELKSILPWPDRLSWRVNEEHSLEVAGSQNQLLAAGQSVVLGPYAASSKLTVLVNKPTGKDWLGRWRHTLVPIDAGVVPFESEIRITFHGVLPLQTIDIR